MSAVPSRLSGLRVRRILSVWFTFMCIAATWMLWQSIALSLGDSSMASGWTLLAATLGLYGLGWRKRHIALRLGPVSAWLQMHSYLGIFALGVFALHVGWPISGRFEAILSAVFLFISGSGGLLLWHSRRVPRMLAAVKRDLRMEDIPCLQRDISDQAHQIVLQCAGATAGGPLADFYQRRLLSFFVAPRSLIYRCWPTGTGRRQLLRELEDLDRYLDPETRNHRVALSQLVIAKDDTDFHAALQKRLRFLMTAHVALTWTLWLLIALHVALVLRFSGAMV